MSKCRGCAFQHPSQRQHSCLMMDVEDVWMYYYDDVEGKHESFSGFENRRKCVQCAWYQTGEVVGSIRYSITQDSLDKPADNFTGIPRIAPNTRAARSNSACPL